MVRSIISPQVEYSNLDELLQNLEKDTIDRRKSVLVSNEEDDAEDAWAIITTGQLQHWVKSNPVAVLTMLNELREQRDLGLEATRLYNRGNDKDQKEIEQLRKRSKKLDKELAKVRTEFQTLQAQREASTLSNTSNKEHNKWITIPDPPYLTDGKDPTYEEWLIAIRDKLSVHEDNFRDGLHQIAYVCSRTQGRAAKILEVRRRPNTLNSFDSVSEVFEELEEQLADPDRKQNVKRSYQLLEQDSMPITDFFLKFQEYASYLGKPDDDMILDATAKFNNRMKSWADNLQEPFTNFSKFRKRAIQVDNNHQATRRAREQKEKEDHRPRVPIKVSFVPNRAIATSMPKHSFRPRIKETKDQQQDVDAKDGNCFTCHQPGHLSPDCPNKRPYVPPYKRDLNTRVNAIHDTSGDEYENNHNDSDKDSLYSDAEN